MASTAGIYFLCFGDWKPRIKVWAGLVPSETVRENLLHAPPPTFCWLAVFGLLGISLFKILSSREQGASVQYSTK